MKKETDWLLISGENNKKTFAQFLKIVFKRLNNNSFHPINDMSYLQISVGVI